MCKLFDDWSEEIRRYCAENGFQYEKAKKLSQCWGSNFLALQYHDPKKGVNGLLNEAPMPTVLFIRKENDKLVFNQTKYTKMYLS